MLLQDEFNNGVISLAAERLHTVLGLYASQCAKGEISDVDAAFAHAVDETLGFHRELATITGYEMNVVIHVLTKAENLVRWLAVEKKCTWPFFLSLPILSSFSMHFSFLNFYNLKQQCVLRLRRTM